MGFKRDVHIHAPIDQVFRVTTTYEYAPKVLSHIADIEIVGDAPIGVGSKIKETRKISQTQVENMLEVVEYEPNKRFAIHSEQNGLDLDYVYTFSEVDGGTRVEFEGKIKAKGLRNIMMKPLINRIIKKEDGDHLDKLKQYIHNQDSDEK
ncbi:SRPBCC family protein [Tenuibacillus multivorans]|uniref:Polyketide cyclase / dehydrase and lipid transport n=1 Tax=Tenuibacillus multivorans TaxID=237069 RepID=A0A1G9WPP2_9BACI|nr:SRPBCC family protein [Tenuibacillus multivorans]GEL77977.1 hypothetical protein TMU01_22120 [Tenuibacillus multivorans]SDM86544.1 Polyketide cyclase / dehydrase and lipid transport [Tenuibacillus multivorans]